MWTLPCIRVMCVHLCLSSCVICTQLVSRCFGHSQLHLQIWLMRERPSSGLQPHDGQESLWGVLIDSTEREGVSLPERLCSEERTNQE